jgi:pyruvate dehydrogenase E1 component alpha subunit
MKVAAHRPLQMQRRAVVRPRVARAPFKVHAVAAPTATESTTRAIVSPEVAKTLYYDMTLGREFEEMCAQVRVRLFASM